MEEGESKTCENCKREIPAVNFTTHTVFCARNIRVCPVCKEPVPHAELQDHHEKMHKLLPCKQCGESVCGTDLEDHIRDSCAHTMKSCKFCQLELRRSSMPSHERYCGARTEQCSDCGEWVMHKYRQLHLDSNHGFIRLDDDPVPTKKDDKTTNVPKPLNVPKPITSSDAIKTNKPYSNGIVNTSVTRPTTQIRHFTPSYTLEENVSFPSTSQSQVNGSSSAGPSSSSRSSNLTAASSSRAQGNQSPLTDRTNQPYNVVADGYSSSHNGAIPRVKRTNDQPQVNTDAVAPDKVQKDLWANRGAVKKRPAPQPPGAPRMPDLHLVRGSKQELQLRAYQRQLRRESPEQRRLRDETAYFMSQGLPPPSSLTAKIEKVKMIDRIQNSPELDEQVDQNGLKAREWVNRSIEQCGYLLSSPANTSTRTGRELAASRRRRSQSRSPHRIDRAQAANAQAANSQAVNSQAKNAQAATAQANAQASSSQAANSQTKNAQAANSQGSSTQARRNDLRDLKPMTPQEFEERFNELRLRSPGEGSSGEGRRGERPGEEGDRFSLIKSSLRELRRGLNEVTAPYNANANNEPHQSGRTSPVRSPVRSPVHSGPHSPVHLPCEFCGAPVPEDDLVQHQTGCRPDLARYQPDWTDRPDRSDRSDRPDRSASEPAVYIPCEFCAEPQPVYLLSEHQEQCGRDADMLYPG